MAYGNYHAVDITVTAKGANTFSFRAEPFDECSVGSGKIRVNRGKIENLMHAQTIDSLCRFILDALDMDEELERAGKSELLEQMPLPEILELLDGSERLGDVFRQYSRFVEAMEQGISSVGQIKTVSFSETDYSWGYVASERFTDFMAELGFAYEDYEPFEDGENEEALEALESKLNGLYGEKLFPECTHEELADCCVAVCDGRDGPTDFCAQRVFTLDLMSGEILQTWGIKHCST